MTDKNKNSTPQWVITHLEKKHNKTLFASGVEALDRYLRNQASQDIKKSVAVTYVITEVDADRILGYYTLSSVGIFPGELPETTLKKLPRYPVLPGVLLGRLAVDQEFQGRKIGAMLLIDALKRSIGVSHQIGIVAMIVEAKDEKSESFYKYFGFIPLRENQGRLFLILDSLKSLELQS